LTPFPLGRSALGLPVKVPISSGSIRFGGVLAGSILAMGTTTAAVGRCGVLGGPGLAWLPSPGVRVHRESLRSRR
jgi:hypothetical protein